MSELDDLLPTRSRKPRPGTKLFWVLVILTTIAIAGCLVLIKPEYRATSLLMVDASGFRPPMSMAQPVLPLEQMERMAADQVERIKSDSVISEALKSVDVMQTRWYREGKASAGGDVSPLLDVLKRDLKVRVLPGTSCIEVALRTEAREDAPRIVNAVIDKCLAELEATSRIARLRELDVYRSQAAEKLNVLRARRESLKLFQTTQFRDPGIALGHNYTAERVAFLDEEVLRLEAAKLQAKARYENLKAFVPEALADSPEVCRVVDFDPRVQWLRQEILAGQIDLESRSPEKPENEGELAALRNRLKALEIQLPALLKECAKQECARQLKAAEMEYLSATQAEFLLRERLESDQAALHDHSVKSFEYEAMKSEVNFLEAEYQQVASFTNQLELGLAVCPTAVHRVAMAQIPGTRDYYKPIVFAASIGAVPLVYGMLLLIARATLAARRKLV